MVDLWTCLKLTDVGRPGPLFPGGAELYENGEIDLSTSKGAYVHSVLTFSDCECDVSSFCLVSFPE